MKSLNEWLAGYSASHQNPKNKMIHDIAVSVIFFCTIALLWKISIILFVPVVVGIIAFYYTMGEKVAIAGASGIGAAWLLQLIIGFGFITLLILFALAWAGQFYKHQWVNSKPGVLDIANIVLIGPLWVARPLLDKYEIR